MANRITELRKETDAKTKGKASIGARLVRAKAMVTIMATTEDPSTVKTALTNKGTADAAQKNAAAAAKKAKADKDAEKAIAEKFKADKAKADKADAKEKVKVATPKREPLIGGNDAGEELTLENLSKKNRPEIIEIATKMDIPLRRGISARGIVNAILLKELQSSWCEITSYLGCCPDKGWCSF